MQTLRLLAFCLSVHLVLSDPVITAPVFMWSNTQFFNGVNLQSVDYISASDLSGAAQHKESTLNQFISSKSTPELIVVFAEPSLRTEQVSVLSHSFNKQPNGGAFSNIKRMMETSESSLALPHAQSQSMAFATQLISHLQQTAASVVSVGATGISLSELMEKLNDPSWSVLNNKQTDLIVVYFTSPALPHMYDDSDAHASYAADDASVATIIAAIEKQATSYLAIFTADQEVYGSQVDRTVEVRKDFGEDPSYSTNWPDDIVEGLIMMIPFLLILLFAINASMALQSGLKMDFEKTIMKNIKQ